MIDLIDAIIDYFDNSADAAAVAMRAACGNLIADMQLSSTTYPRTQVHQVSLANEYESLGKAGRVEVVVIQFLTYTTTRKKCIEALNALKAAYVHTDLTYALGEPKVLDCIATWNVDNYCGTLNLEYWLEIDPQ